MSRLHAPTRWSAFFLSALAMVVATLSPLAAAQAVEPAAPGSAVGTVLDGTTPIADAHLSLRQLIGTPGTWESWDYSGDTFTAEDGSYAFGDLTPGAYYTVYAQAPGMTSRYLGDTQDWSTAQYFQAQDGLGHDLAPITLVPGKRVTGVVTHNGAPVADVDVEALRWDGSTFQGTSWGVTDENGQYAIDDLESGTYTLWFNTHYSDANADSVFLGGAVGMPADTSDPATVFTVDDSNPSAVEDITLPDAITASGRVLGTDAQPLSAANVLVYQWVEDYWEFYAQAQTGEDGAYSVKVPRNASVTLRFGAAGYTRQYLGGGSEEPGAPTAANALTVSDADITVQEVTLQAFDSRFGDVAGQPMDFCYNSSLPNQLDVSSGPVQIPSEFGLTFFGQPYTELFVNSHGNISFGSENLTFTPEGLTGQTGRPIIAPFWADVDQTGNDQVTTYGFSPDGKSFCAVWADMGYFNQHVDKLNTFQLVLTSAQDEQGRSAGDFDITFNYDQVEWESGDMSGGVSGLGGTTGAVGFSAGTGIAGSYMELPGSLEPGAFLAGGARDLLANSLSSIQPGRYVFEVRNEGMDALYGGMTGAVEDSNGQPVVSAYVEACSTGTTSSYCIFTQTDESGAFDFPAVLPGDYSVRVWPPNGELFGGGAAVTVTEGEVEPVPTITLSAPEPMPDGVTLENVGVSGGVPSVFYGDDLDFQVKGCPGVENPMYSVTKPDGTPLLDAGGSPRTDIPLTETSQGVYEAVIPAFSPYTGEAKITTNVLATCGGSPVEFNLYIDPSGIVTDQYGRPVAGATVTLLRSDSEAGDYAVVTDRTVMSPSNRNNPDTTNADGYFRWDVVSGWYKVTVEKEGCTPFTSPAMSVPPERIDLLLKLSCSGIAAPEPVVAPTLSGTAKAGETLVTTKGEWPAPLEWSKTEWFRGTTKVGEGTSYTVTDADAGQTITARVSAVRPDYQQEQGSGALVAFTPVSVELDVTVEGTPAGGGSAGGGGTGGGGTGGGGGDVSTEAPRATALPSISGSARVGAELTASNGTWDKPNLTYTYQWLRDGQVVPGADGKTYAPVAADLGSLLSVEVTAKGNGLQDGTARSMAVAIEQGLAPHAVQAPTVEGRAAVGRTLTVDPGAWDMKGLAFSYQWFRNGEAIRGATGATRRLRVVDAGQDVAVVVTAKKPGHKVRRLATDAVEVAKLRSTTTTELVAAAVSASKISVEVAVPGMARPVGRIVVRVDGERVEAVRLARRHAGERNVTITGLAEGAHRVVVVYRGSSRTLGSRDAMRLRIPR